MPKPEPERVPKGRRLLVLASPVCGTSGSSCPVGRLIDALQRVRDTTVIPLEEAVNPLPVRLTLSDVEPQVTASVQDAFSAHDTVLSSQGHSTLRLKVASRNARGKGGDDPFGHLLAQTSTSATKATLGSVCPASPLLDSPVTGSAAAAESIPKRATAPDSATKIGSLEQSPMPPLGALSSIKPERSSRSPTVKSPTVISPTSRSPTLKSPTASSPSGWNTAFAESVERAEAQHSLYEETPTVQEMVSVRSFRVPHTITDATAAEQSPSSGLLGMLVSMVSSSMSPTRKLEENKSSRDFSSYAAGMPFSSPSPDLLAPDKVAEDEQLHSPTTDGAAVLSEALQENSEVTLAALQSSPKTSCKDAVSHSIDGCVSLHVKNVAEEQCCC